MASNYRIAEEMGADWCPALPGEVVGLHNSFMASAEWAQWIRYQFIEDETRLHNSDHSHLRFATIGILLTSAENKKQGKRVVGTAQMPRPKPGWAGALAEWHQRRFFGIVPTFIITLDANYMLECSPGSLCALIEHELYHCGQAKDEFGFPKFSKKTGKPIFAMRPHDVEEFIGVTRRYGALSSAGGTAKLVEAANCAPIFDDVDVATICCGTDGCNH
jgi:hypothetical protein